MACGPASTIRQTLQPSQAGALQGGGATGQQRSAGWASLSQGPAAAGLTAGGAAAAAQGEAVRRPSGQLRAGAVGSWGDGVRFPAAPD